LETVAKIDVFPNPASEFFTLELEGLVSENVNVRLLTPTGQMVYSQTDLSLNSTTEIPVANLSAGIYFLQINSETATTIRRVMIE